MNKEHICTSAYGIKAPIIREGDNLADIVVDCVLNATKTETISINKKASYSISSYDIDDKDIIGITESVVARAQGNYVTLDDIAKEIKEKLLNPKDIVLVNPIYSRNRFSMILKAIARAAKESVSIYMPDFDEVGNPSEVNPFTGVNMKEYYTDIVNKEGKKCTIFGFSPEEGYYSESSIIYCGLHDFAEWNKKYGNKNRITLADICSDKCQYGLLGSNKATEEKLKLFPNKIKAHKLLHEIKDKIKEITGKDVLVCSYGDGCFKDAVGGIWEFADPITMPAYTNPEVFESTPNEIKIKAFADDKYKDLNGKALEDAIKSEIVDNVGKDLKGNMTSQGTTPRLYRDLIASLMDLTTGSGGKGTPIVLIKNYFDNYATN